MLQVKDLSYGTWESPKLQTLSFTLPPATLLLIKGENGVGKTLLLKVLAGSHPKNTGSISSSFLTRSFLPQIQNRSLHIPFSLGELLALASPSAVNSDFIPPEKLSLAWNSASGGEKQRALLALCFQQDADLMLLDEPFNHLDLEAKELVRKKILDALKRNKAVVLVAHDEPVDTWLENYQSIQLESRQ